MKSPTRSGSVLKICSLVRKQTPAEQQKITAIISKGAKAVIPARRNRKEKREIDDNLYKDRNKIERFFNRLKHYRRIATRYEKTGRNYLSFILVGAIMTLLL